MHPHGELVPGSKGKVLVVDDDAAVRGLTSDMLTAEGYTVSTAADLEQALQVAEDMRPDAILFAILRPPAGVIDFARRLALKSSVRFTPLLMVTALNEYQIGSFLDGVPGVRRILVPPCGPDVVSAEVAHAIQHVRR